MDDQPGNGEVPTILLHGRCEKKAGDRQREVLARIGARRKQAHNTLLEFRQEAHQSGCSEEAVVVRVIERLCDDLQVDGASFTLAGVRYGRSYQFSRSEGTKGMVFGSLAAEGTLPSHCYTLRPPIPGVTASFRALLYRDGSSEPYACLALFCRDNRSLHATEISLADEVAEWAARYLTAPRHPGALYR